jgi:hypothetical protein
VLEELSFTGGMIRLRTTTQTFVFRPDRHEPVLVFP